MPTTTSGSTRRPAPPRAPARPRDSVPVCEDCGQAEVALCCECCGQELCQGCWADGDDALCGPCRRGDWDDVTPEVVVPVGLFVTDELPTSGRGLGR